MKNFTSNNQKTGKLGEDIACKYLEGKGFIIKDRNYTKKWGEIDIVAQKGNEIYFIEVKAVTCVTFDFLEHSNGRIRPEENMHPWKMKRLRRTVETYLIHNRIGNTPWRFDLALVYLNMTERTARVKMIENIIL